MKYLEHRRHSIREKSGPHLNQHGVNLARKVANPDQKFDYVVTSHIKRAWETSLVMGYAVNEMRPELFIYGEVINRELSMETTYKGLKLKYDRVKAIRDYAQFQINFIYQVLNKIMDEQSILMVSHGLIIDIPLLEMFPDANYDKWGEILNYCEGYKIKYDGEQFLDLEFLRI